MISISLHLLINLIYISYFDEEDEEVIKVKVRMNNDE